MRPVVFGLTGSITLVTGFEGFKLIILDVVWTTGLLASEPCPIFSWVLADCVGGLADGLSVIVLVSEPVVVGFLLEL